jgi:hypothetical protein
MALNVEMVTFDCSDPAKLGGWWAEQFGGTTQELLAGEFTAVTLAEGPKPVPRPSPNPDPKQGGRATNACRRDGAGQHPMRAGETDPNDAGTDFRPPRRSELTTSEKGGGDQRFQLFDTL